MSILTQGTEVFALVPTIDDPTVFAVLKVDCPTAFDPGTDTTDEIETTCLDETEARTYKPGLETPAEATLTINADPANESHVRLYQLRKVPLKWVVGWADGTSVPTVATGSAADDFVLPPTRTWFTFEGYISAFPFAFEVNAVVSTAMTIRRSGGSAWIQKVVTP